MLWNSLVGHHQWSWSVFFSLFPDVFTEAFFKCLMIGSTSSIWFEEKIILEENYKITCVWEKEREMNVCVQIFLTQAACHLLNSFREINKKDKHKNCPVRVEVNSCVWNHFSRVAYTLDLTRFLLVKCRGTAHWIESKNKKKQSHFFTSSFLEFI